MQSDSRYPWFLLELGIFIAINAVLLAIIKPTDVFQLTFSPLQLIIFGLAVFRGANIVSSETIMRPFRAPFNKKVEEPKSVGLKGAIGFLLHCPSCSGVWVAMILIYSYLLWPVPMWVIILILALSGVERIIFHLLSRIKNYS